MSFSCTTCRVYTQTLSVCTVLPICSLQSLRRLCVSRSLFLTCPTISSYSLHLPYYSLKDWQNCGIIRAVVGIVGGTHVEKEQGSRRLHLYRSRCSVSYFLPCKPRTKRFDLNVCWKIRALEGKLYRACKTSFGKHLADRFCFNAKHLLDRNDG